MTGWLWGAALYGAAGVASGVWHPRKLSSDTSFKGDYNKLAGPVEDLFWLVPPAVYFGVTPPTLLRWLFAASTALWWPLAVLAAVLKLAHKDRGDVSK